MKEGNLRWWMLSLVFWATVINILDRLVVSVLAPVIRANLHLSNLDYAEVGTWFLLAYTVSQGLSGLMHDRIGVKKGYSVSVAVWSSAALLHALAHDLFRLTVFRVLLGLGEGGNWPGAVKVISYWFPLRERAFALGVMNGGSSFGAMIAPPLIIWLQLQLGWQASFLVTGSLGFLWLIAWQLWYRMPKEKVVSATDHPPEAVPAIQMRINLFKVRKVWAIVLARFLVDPIWWLYILWLPEYLNHARGISLKDIGFLASVPFITGGLGGLCGGGLSGYLIGKGWTVNRARKTTIILAAGLMPCGILAAFTDNTAGALAWISVVTFAFQAWINNVQVLPADLFPSRYIGSVAGLGGVGAGVGSMIFTLCTGWTVDHFSYTPILIAAGVLGPLGTIALFRLVGTIEPIEQAENV